MLANPALLTVALVAALVFALGSVWFGRFELETPKWRRSLKLLLTVALPAALAARFGATVGLVLIGFFFALGLSFHFLWCKRHGIDPWTAEPWQRYRELRGWAR
jgi:hypothetical protein